MSREDPQLRIRLPIELKEIIESSSKENNRSMNAEIITLLELAIRVCKEFGPDNGPVVQQFKQRLADIDKKQDALEEEITMTSKDMERMVKKISNNVLEQITKSYDLVPKISNQEPADTEWKNKKPT
ncbi:TPA: Arc family DNA-binding protein [Escherichia coli]